MTTISFVSLLFQKSLEADFSFKGLNKVIVNSHFASVAQFLLKRLISGNLKAD
jgi:hypothetical protein